MQTTNTRTITLIIVFAALAIALIPVRIPTYFWPGQYYRLWEIPIIIAFLMFGFKIGFPVAILNAAGFLIFPDSSGIIGPPWSIVLMLSMFQGLYIASKLVGRKNLQEKNPGKKPVFYYTFFAVLSRVIIMPIVDYGVFRFLLPLVIGHNISEAYIFALMPAVVFFNITVPLYTIPIAYFTAKTVGKNLRMGNKL